MNNYGAESPGSSDGGRAASQMPFLSPADFRRLAVFIENELGIRMPESKRVMLEARLQKRLRLLALPSYNKYIDHVFSDGRQDRAYQHDRRGDDQ